MTVGSQPILNGHVPTPQPFLGGPAQLTAVDRQAVYRLVVILYRGIGCIAVKVKKKTKQQVNLSI